MASTPTVTLTLAGDEKKLTESFDRVGQAAQSMGSEVDAASEEMQRAGRSADALADSADTVDTRAMGFRDTLTGLQDGFEGLTVDSDSLMESLLLIGFGIGDLASGFVNLLIPAVSSFWTWLTSTTAATWLVTAAKTAWTAVTGLVTTAMGALNAVIRANPIMFLVGLVAILVTAFLALWTRSEGFRNFFIGMWNGIKSVVGAVVDWIVDRWNDVVGFFSDIPQRIGSALGAIGGFFESAFKGAANAAIDAVNWMIDRINDLIYGVNLINPFGDIPSIPHIERLHTGGVVGGMPGSEQLAILQAGERVVPRGQAARGGASVTFAGDVDSAFATAFMRLVRTGQIQIQAG